MSKVQFDINCRVVRDPEPAQTMTLEQAMTVEDFISRGGIERFPERDHERRRDIHAELERENLKVIAAGQDEEDPERFEDIA